MKDTSNAQYDTISSANEESSARLKQAEDGKRLTPGIVPMVYHTIRRAKSFNSKYYWERRYQSGGRSGAGSYGRLAEFKAEYLNVFASKQDIASVIEFGSGDGAQLRLFDFKRYIGLDVSRASIRLCMQQYGNDESKSFYLYDAEFAQDNHHLFSAELSLSLDVIYHLVEDDVFDAYMRALFAAAEKFVIIYASNTNDNSRAQPQHVRHRKFTDWIQQHAKDWALYEHTVNKYCLKTNEVDESFADFYIYRRKNVEVVI